MRPWLFLIQFFPLQSLAVSWTEEKSEDDTNYSLDEKDLITPANYEDSLAYNPPDYESEAHYEWSRYLAEIPQGGEQNSFKGQKCPRDFSVPFSSTNCENWKCNP